MVAEIGDLTLFHSRTPKSIVKVNLFEGVPEHVRGYARELRDIGWTFYAVKQTRGYCNAVQRIITIPTWVLPKTDKKIWYISHELAHAYDRCQHKHGPEFMEWLKRICPEEYQHFELGYKPRNAQAAGVSLKGLL